MQRIRRLLAAAAGTAVFAFPLAAPAADVDPPLPLTVKQRLIELTASPATPGRGRCVNPEAMRALVGAAPDYADEIALFAARRLLERTPRADEDCSCLIDLARAIGGAIPERSAPLSRVVAEQVPACGGLISRGIDAPQGASGGIAINGRTASDAAVARNTCFTSRTCATPLLRPDSGLIGPTRLGGDS